MELQASAAFDDVCLHGDVSEDAPQGCEPRGVSNAFTRSSSSWSPGPCKSGETAPVSQALLLKRRRTGKAQASRIRRGERARNRRIAFRMCVARRTQEATMASTLRRPGPKEARANESRGHNPLRIAGRDQSVRGFQADA